MSSSFPPCTAYSGNGEGTFTCIGSNCPRANRALWGTANEGVYTADSSPCRAARCTGVIGPLGGGSFTLVPCPGRAAYHGGSNNGVQCSSWGDFPQSMTVAPPSASLSMFSPLKAQQQKEVPCSQYQTDSCSGSFICPGADKCPRAPRAVWGHRDMTETFFTGDSSPCAAARAAAIIPDAGGSYRLAAVGSRTKIDGFVGASNVIVRKWSTYEQCFAVKSTEDAGAATHSLRPPPEEPVLTGKGSRKYD